MASQQLSGRAASMARRQQQVNGKSRSYAAPAAPAPTRQPRDRKPAPVATPAPAPQTAAYSAPVTSYAAPAPVSRTPASKPAQKSASRLRREALAARGKRADTSKDRQRTHEMIRTAKPVAETKVEYCCDECRQDKECASTVATTLLASLPAATSKPVAKKKPVVNSSNSGRMLSRARRVAMSGRGKAGLDAHGKGNATAALARQANPEISSRDLAKVVRDSRSKGGAKSNTTATPARARRPRNAAEAMRISGTKVGHTEKITGDETGLCHTGITGTQYMAAEIFNAFCQAEPPKAPKKVETTETLSGNKVTSGGKVGSGNSLTGVERGMCRDITGTEYLGSEHFKGMCDTTPPAAPAKISTSRTQRGIVISGPKPSQHENVTGNERGECRAVTGTPYLGQETFQSVCTTEEQRANRRIGVMPRVGGGRDISGQQPAMTGLTGNEKGACQLVSGTPYLAETEFRSVCNAEAALPGDSDFPQSLGGNAEVAGEFSILPTVMMPAAEVQQTSPEAAAPASKRSHAVTGSGYENQNSVTGAFSMGKGKVTGTEQARFGNRNVGIVEKKEQPANEPQIAARITGEGIDVGLKITGDDWDRGDRVTGTEGGAALRNPTRRGPVTAMPSVEQKRDPQRERPSAPVTGSSGGAQGTKVTVSGGARG